jgi:hypothetical protein
MAATMRVMIPYIVRLQKERKCHKCLKQSF